ncbi:nucleotidyltransferase family protein [Saccharolobus islandicus]|uniref:hypothetical protein n=1 Tax=Saccharolobus islandicus TaxID=43080 RepID=UPI000362F822|nr:hypothetical protein [Sulfolobus islandicus]
MEIEWKYKNAFRIAIKEIRRFYPEFAIIGRFARNFYANPETTLDIDFIANLDDVERLAEFIEHISSHYEIFPNDVGHWQYKIIIKGVRVDLVKPPQYKFDDEVISRRRIVRIEGVGEVPILSAEDLVTLYVVASINRGVKDLIKAKDIIIYSLARHDFNEDYFLRKCEENSVKALCLTLLSN